VEIALWIVSGLLAAAYLFAGTNKAIRPKDKLVAGGLTWAGDFSPATIKFIGIVEILGAIGLILPWLTGIAPVLTPIAATGLVIVQLLAIIVHIRRHEAKVIPMNLLLLVAALFIAIFRFAAL
jgi:DoxX-like family